MTSATEPSLAVYERAALCDSALEFGPDAPTLCAGWTVRDLLAHMMIRERRPDAVVGVVLSPFAGHTAKVQNSYAQRPFEEVVAELRNGPGWMFALPGTDAIANATEYFIHHEDIRRGDGTGDWQPREFPAHVDRALRAIVSQRARFILRRSPVGLTLVTPDGTRYVAKKGEPEVVVTGEPGELVLWMHGRDAVRVDLSGDPVAIAAVRSISRGI